MTVRVELPDGTAWEHEDVYEYRIDAGALMFFDQGHGVIAAAYAPGTWVYAERVS